MQEMCIAVFELKLIFTYSDADKTKAELQNSTSYALEIKSGIKVKRKKLFYTVQSSIYICHNIQGLIIYKENLIQAPNYWLLTRVLNYSVIPQK